MDLEKDSRRQTACRSRRCHAHGPADAMRQPHSTSALKLGIDMALYLEKDTQLHPTTHMPSHRNRQHDPKLCSKKRRPERPWDMQSKSTVKAHLFIIPSVHSL